jgi:hypothetical protein
MSHEAQSASAELCGAYRATTYRVYVHDVQFDLRIDESHPRFAQWLRNAGKTCAAVITAWNPGSRPASPAENDAQQRQLQQAVRAMGLEWLPAINLAPVEGATPSTWNEESLLVLDVDQQTARTIAARFGQVALVYISQHAPPRLVFTAAGMPGN